MKYIEFNGVSLLGLITKGTFKVYLRVKEKFIKGMNYV